MPSYNQKTTEVNFNYVIKQFNARVMTFYRDTRFNAVHFTGGKSALAVGAKGRIFRSNGGGRLWRRPSGELVKDDRNVATLGPDRPARLDRSRTAMPAHAGGADLRGQDVAAPAVQRFHECREQRDDREHGNGRPVGEVQHTQARRGQADRHPFDVLVTDKEGQREKEDRQQGAADVDHVVTHLP